MGRGNLEFQISRRDQERSAELEDIRVALTEGESSGEPRPLDTEEFKQEC
ncbi:MAG: hypothetical protein JWR17_4366 [Pseudomonas sp.]|jgi:antitoxin ParD1/3/4|nr:hypothetical protein [Pseudomonas sp.]